MLVMDYIPEDELEVKVTLLKPGQAEFIIKGFQDKDQHQSPMVNKKGEKMVKLELIVTDSQQQKSMVYDYITQSTQWKLKSLSESIGWPELYSKDSSGKISFDPSKVIGMNGDCTIKLSASPGYKDKTVIDKYLKASSPRMNRHLFPDDGSDDLPF
jgi:hypothetical protein